MALRIITAEERLSHAANKSTVALFGPSGVGKTTQLKRLPEQETVCIDLEAGLKSVQDWRGDSLPVRTFADAIDIYTGLDRKDATLVSMLRLRLGLFAETLQKGEWWEAIKTVGSYGADTFLTLVPSFADYDSVTQVAGGRVVPLAELGYAVLVLGVLYPLLLLCLGWFLLERRDLVSTAS